jgi:hypothetical protein
MTFSTNQLRDYSSLFSRGEVLRWFKNDFQSIDVKLKRYGHYEKYQGHAYLNVIRETYRILEKQYPNEYVLKNGFINEWLIKELGNCDSIIFNEFKLGKAIVDLAMFNGVSKAFEIKTILDTEFRLSMQLSEYKKIFNEVYIVVPKEQLQKYSGIDKTVGIIGYDGENFTFESFRKPIVNNSIDVSVLMEVLHTKEYLSIVKSHFPHIPAMNSFNQFGICKSLIAQIPFPILNKIFIATMKKREVNNSFFKKRNNELNQICLALNLDKVERENLLAKLSCKLV